MILFGGRGAGKSTFIKRFLFHEQPIEIVMHSKVALVPLLFSSQTKEALANEIWQKVFESIEAYGLTKYLVRKSYIPHNEVFEYYLKTERKQRRF